MHYLFVVIMLTGKSVLILHGEIVEADGTLVFGVVVVPVHVRRLGGHPRRLFLHPR